MVRWLFIMLLLLNVIYLGWQLQHQRKAAVYQRPAGVTEIKLLSETDRSLLLRREERPSLETGLSQEDPEPEWCHVVTGLSSVETVEQLLLRLQQMKLDAYVTSSEEERVVAYELILAQPVLVSEQQALKTSLIESGMMAEPSVINSKPVYIIGRYGSRTELNRARQLLTGLFDPGIYQVVGKENLFTIWIQTGSGEKSGNKIKQLAGYFPGDIKIEKKYCKGVASTGVRD